MEGPTSYPPTRTVDAFQEVAGVRFADPYQWLQEPSDEVRGWQRAQGDLAAAYVREWQHFAPLRDEVARLNVSRIDSVPRFAGGRWFRTELRAGAGQAVAVVEAEPFGGGQVVFDPADEDREHPPYLSWIAPSPDGRLLAVGVCRDGSENNRIRLVDVKAGSLLPEPPSQLLMDSWTGGVHWLPDSSGFFFTALAGEGNHFQLGVFLHRLGPRPETVPLAIPGVSGRDYHAVLISRDGRHAVAVDRLVTPIPVAVCRLSESRDLRWRPFVTRLNGMLAGHLLGRRFVAVTNIGAPRGRLVAIDVDTPDPNDPATWRELVPESDAVLRAVTPVGDVLYLTELVDTYARVRIVDGEGAPRGTVPLPAAGALGERSYPLMTMWSKGHPDQFVFSFSSLTTSWGVYRHEPGRAGLEVLKAPDVSLPDVVVEDRWVESAGEARVPYHVVRRADLDAAEPQPTLVHAYGGFNSPWVPEFPGPMAAFVSAGGVYVHGHLRGGGEFGEDWWQAGRMLAKPNCFADLYAIAQDLIDRGETTPRRLAMVGASNGGLLAGVAITQRPDLWAAVVPRVALLDVIGGCDDPYTRMAIGNEFGNPDDAEEVRRLATFSPYHLIADGRTYPAVFLDAGDTDPRCPAWHARKFGARLQAATAGSAPVLVRVWENAGHGWATARELATTEHAEWLAFVMRTLDLEPNG